MIMMKRQCLAVSDVQHQLTIEAWSSDMYVQATVAILDRKMAILRAEISEQAALAAQRHKFNQGSLQPTGNTSPGRLASGLAATAHVSTFFSSLKPTCAAGISCKQP